MSQDLPKVQLQRGVCSIELLMQDKRNIGNSWQQYVSAEMKECACGEYILRVYQSMQEVESQHINGQFYKTLSARHQSVDLPVTSNQGS